MFLISLADFTPEEREEMWRERKREQNPHAYISPYSYDNADLDYKKSRYSEYVRKTERKNEIPLSFEWWCEQERF